MKTQFHRNQLMALLVLAALPSAWGQVELSWLRTYDRGSTDQGNGIAIDTAGNCYVTGVSRAGSDYDLVILKYSADGALAWVRVYDASATLDTGRGIAVDAEGAVYVAGSTESPTTRKDGVLLKYSPGGDQLWARVFDWRGDNDSFSSIAIDSDGEIYVMGSATDPSHSLKGDYLLAKYGPDGASRWVSTYGPTDGEGAPTLDYPKAMVLAGNGDVYVTGYTFGSWPDRQPAEDILTVCWSSGGVRRWIQQYNHLGLDWYGNRAYAVTTDASGNAYVGGQTWSGTSGDQLVLKYSSSGTMQWVKTWNGASNADDIVSCIVADASGNVYVGGSANNGIMNVRSSASLLKYNSSGTRLWARTDQIGQFVNIVLHPNGSTYVGNDNGAVSRFTSDGLMLWSHESPALPQSGLRVDPTYGVFVGGGYSGDYAAARLVEQVRLVVSSETGNAMPPSGMTVLPYGISTNAAILSSPIESGGTQYVCSGWIGSGSVPQIGVGLCTGTLVFTNDSTITWLWQTNYLASATVMGQGQLTFTTGWCRAMSTLSITAMPNPYSPFGGWSGDISLLQQKLNPLQVAITSPRTVYAHFQNSQTASSVPIWWLAQYGLTNGTWDAAAEADQDSDQFTTWQEYVAGTDPTNGNSVLALSGLRMVGSAAVELTWPSQDGVTYSILGRTNLMASVERVEATALAGMPPVNCHTVNVSSAKQKFFHLKANRPGWGETNVTLDWPASATSLVRVYSPSAGALRLAGAQSGSANGWFNLPRTGRWRVELAAHTDESYQYLAENVTCGVNGKVAAVFTNYPAGPVRYTKTIFVDGSGIAFHFDFVSPSNVRSTHLVLEPGQAWFIGP